ncbi:MAG TPA: BamA/TamA family outer membrane protein [Longimicrobiales bacterium]|nr:BamA/TamA family outer membrane protein [Longimicrobiales bacterium]
MTAARAAAVGLAALLAGPVLGPAPAAGQRGSDSVEVRRIEFEGNDSFDDALLRTAILASATRCVSSALLPVCWLGGALDRKYYDPRIFAADSFRVRLFYYQRGFREAQIALDTVRSGAGVTVQFRIAEGRPVVVQSVHFEGAEAMPASLLRNLSLRPGEPLSEPAFQATRDTLRARLQDRGFYHADVLANYDILRAAPYDARVEYQLLPGPATRFGAIEVRGANRVDSALVRRMLAFRTGDPYSRRALLQSQRNLFGLEIFRHAEITTLPAVADTVVPVRVQVNEGDLHRVRFGMGVSTAEFLNAEGRWTSRNFMGGLRRLEVRGRVTNLVSEPLGSVRPPFERCADIYCDLSGSLNVDFAQPRFLATGNTFGAGTFLERVTVPQVYVRTSGGAYTSLSRTLGPGTVVAVAYRPELTRLESAEEVFCVNFTACEAEEISVLRRRNRLAPLALSLARERANSLFAPTRGYALRIEGEVASVVSGSEFSYFRLLGEAVRYGEPFRGVVLATRLRPGWARALGAPGENLGLHPQKRFFAGGPNSVRGYAQYRLGPKLLTVDAARVLTRPDSLGGAPCTPQAINGGTCDLSGIAADYPGELDERPVGGSVLIEGNVEVRVPLLLERLRGALFLDFGQVWRTPGEVRLREIAWSPGIGVRYFSPIGPIRIDLGYNAQGAERLSVLTTEVCDASQDPCGPIEPGQSYNTLANRTTLRLQPQVLWDPFDSFTDRLQIHFSIGQAF